MRSTSHLVCKWKLATMSKILNPCIDMCVEGREAHNIYKGYLIWLVCFIWFFLFFRSRVVCSRTCLSTFDDQALFLSIVFSAVMASRSVWKENAVYFKTSVSSIVGLYPCLVSAIISVLLFPSCSLFCVFCNLLDLAESFSFAILQFWRRMKSLSGRLEAHPTSHAPQCPPPTSVLPALFY